MIKMAVLVCLIVSGSVYAEEAKVTKEQHMAAEAACKGIKANMMGKELKECIRTHLGL